MAEESAKRFEAIMDKLFKTPQKSKQNNSSPIITSNISGVQLSKGKKRSNVSAALSIVDPKTRSSAVDELPTASGSSGSVQAPLCRPWDRDDLFRRLATFKSMTWFAKPQAVSALNCARRGWINIDMDIIACESCSARLLFSTPSSWMQQQVEKAALVFSLKLDSGHKLLCPWVDNICDESLAQFPAKPTVVLVEEYKKRFSALLQLSALPLISSSSIDCMRSPQLDEFLEGSAALENNCCADTGGSPVNEHESASSSSYSQAQKLISLCGWELHSLPYIVYNNAQQKQSAETVNSANQSSLASNGLDLDVHCCPSGSGKKEVDSESQVSALADPNSVVFRCSLCSATVGLWTFSLVPRPLEFLRLVGYTEVDGKNDSARVEDENHDANVHSMKTNFATSTSSQEKGSLNLTIAGGPPPAKQNYRATISLPVIGRSLRARFYPDFHVGNNHDLSLAEANITRQGANQTGEQDSKMENSIENMQVVAQESRKDDKVETDDSMANSGNAQVGACIGSSMTNVNNKAGEKNAAIVVESASKKQGDGQHDNASEGSVQLVINNVNPGGLGNTKQAPLHKPMEFDPIRQHRTFCPWIASVAKSVPGWQQALSALQRHKAFSHPLPENAHPLIEVDDPIASVKKLLSSPPAKRAKPAHASND